MFVLAFLALVAIGVAFAGGSMATGEPEATETIVVEPGQTLWWIASDATDGGDVRDMMDHLVELNDLDSVALDAGQSARGPRRLRSTTRLRPPPRPRRAKPPEGCRVRVEGRRLRTRQSLIFRSTSAEVRRALTTTSAEVRRAASLTTWPHVG